ncbi:UNVERIFIED_CONTAM: hypothetical protein Slati_1476900 [Sesamum latifolium]|uniref:Uncharacterized protein n=1 Tax=Sesamum latifolium TaxID=2727402 RepID=A0AAW2XAM6_9LAMI
MNSTISLSSLSHTTHIVNPTLHAGNSHVDADGGDDEADGTLAGINDGGEGNDRPMVATDGDLAVKIQQDFNIKEFLSLAHRVIDEGDEESMAALRDLKDRWTTKFGRGDGLKSISSHQLTPFLPPPVRLARQIPRLPSPEQETAILSVLFAMRVRRRRFLLHT